MKLSIVVSVYNEAESLPEFLKRISGEAFDELIFVNDGSTDGSDRIVREALKDDPRIKLIGFSRNFGHEAAMIAGIDAARGEGIICMDGDLQHPPACIPEIRRKLEEGYDVVNMVRMKNRSAGILKNITSSFFYSVMNKMSNVKMQKNASDFFGLSERAADVLRNSYREKVRFIRGYIQTFGFNRTSLTYEADRRFGGKSKYSFGRLVQLSVNTIMCFSDVPLKLGIYGGIGAIVLGAAMTVYTVVTWAREGTPNGYATIIVLLCFMFAMLFFMIGIIGEYISVIFAEIKDRPIYIVEEALGFDDSDGSCGKKDK